APVCAPVGTGRGRSAHRAAGAQDADLTDHPQPQRRGRDLLAGTAKQCPQVRLGVGRLAALRALLDVAPQPIELGVVDLGVDELEEVLEQLLAVAVLDDGVPLVTHDVASILIPSSRAWSASSSRSWRR